MKLLFLIVYVIVLMIMIQRGIRSISQFVSLKFNKALLDNYLKIHGLDELLEIKCKSPAKSVYRFEPCPNLSFEFKNKSQTHHIALQWNRSTLRNFEGVSQPILLWINNVDQERLLKRQETTLEPTDIFTAEILTEQGIKFHPDGKIEKSNPLFDTKTLQKSAKQKKSFRLRLRLKTFLSNPSYPQGLTQEKNYYLIFEFQACPTPLHQALYWETKAKPKK